MKNIIGIITMLALSSFASHLFAQDNFHIRNGAGASFSTTFQKYEKTIAPRKELALIGGHFENPAEYPWGMGWIETLGEECGFILIHPNYVMTAAHCVDNVSDPNEVILSSFCPNMCDYINISTIIPHPLYNDQFPYNNDIALLRLIQTVNGIEFPSFDDGSSSYPTHTLFSRECGPSGSLMSINLDFHPPQICEQHEPFNQGEGLQGNVQCAGVDLTQNPQTDFCDSDGGAPVIGYQNNDPFLVGIMSYHIGSYNNTNLVTLTKIADHIPWINSVIQ